MAGRVSAGASRRVRVSGDPAIDEDMRFSVNVPGHGWTEHTLLRREATGPTWAAARSLTGELATAVVVDVIDANWVAVIFGGLVYDSAGHGLGTADEPLYCSDSTAGLITTTEPAASPKQMVGWVIDSNYYVVHFWAAY